MSRTISQIVLDQEHRQRFGFRERGHVDLPLAHAKRIEVRQPDREAIDAVRDAISRLSWRRRELALRRIAGERLSVIAKDLGICKNTAYALWLNTKSALREILNGDFAEGCA